jgi:hypothetical protein
MTQFQRSGCLGPLIALFGGSKPPAASKAPATFPYGQRDAFLSPAEQSFFQVLRTIVQPEHYLLTKVNLADLFFVRQPHKNQAARNRINRKHVDFVLCDGATMQPLLGIELDDASHQRQDRRERDEFVDQVFSAAGLPILHVPAARAYNPNDLAGPILAIITPERTQGAETPLPDD